MRKKKDKLILISVMILLISQVISADAHIPRRSIVTHVFDGDTIRLIDGSYVRFIGVDTPEKEEEYQKIARDYVAVRLLGMIVDIDYDIDKVDDYGRRLAYVYYYSAGGKSMINMELLEQGLAHVYVKGGNCAYLEPMIKAQRSAMMRKINGWLIWLQDTEREYVSSVNSHIFHRGSCRWARLISRKNRRIYFSKWDAYWEGLSPCRGCRP